MVSTPGEYAYSEGERLSSVVQRAGGLTKDAYPFGSHFFRESVKRVQKLQLDRYISQLEEDILAMTTQAGEKALDEDEAKIYKTLLESKQKLLDKLKTSQPTGRMVVNLDEALLMPSSVNDIEGNSPSTVTTASQEAVLPAASVTVNKIVLSPKLSQVKLS